MPIQVSVGMTIVLHSLKVIAGGYVILLVFAVLCCLSIVVGSLNDIILYVFDVISLIRGIVHLCSILCLIRGIFYLDGVIPGIIVRIIIHVIVIVLAIPVIVVPLSSSAALRCAIVVPLKIVSEAPYDIGRTYQKNRNQQAHAQNPGRSPAPTELGPPFRQTPLDVPLVHQMFRPRRKQEPTAGNGPADDGLI